MSQFKNSIPVACAVNAPSAQSDDDAPPVYQASVSLTKDYDERARILSVSPRSFSPK